MAASTSAFAGPVPFSIGFDNAAGAKTARVFGHLVSPEYFTTVGVEPAMGRFFRADAEREGSAPVAVISHGLWMRLFAGNRDVVRRTIEISGHFYSIVGVAPEGFVGVNQVNGADIFLPFSAYPRVYPAPGLVAQRTPRQSLQARFNSIRTAPSI